MSISTPKRLLFIGSTRLGDAVLSTGLLAAALEKYAPDEVTIACGPVAAPLFAAVPKLKEIIILDKKEKGKRWLRLWLRVAGTRWDAVIDLRNSIISYTVLSRDTRRFIKGDPSLHKAQQLASVLKLETPPLNHIWLSDEAKKFGEEHIPAGAPVLALCPTANWRPKQWAGERFVETARKLPFTRIAVFGAASERMEAIPVMNELKKTHEVIDLVGKTSALEVAACLARTRLVIANDSGLMHIGATMGVPTLGLFGPSSDVEYGPWGSHAAAVREAPYLGYYKTPDHAELMRVLTVDKVIMAVAKLLKS